VRGRLGCVSQTSNANGIEIFDLPSPSACMFGCAYTAVLLGRRSRNNTRSRGTVELLASSEGGRHRNCSHFQKALLVYNVTQVKEDLREKTSFIASSFNTDHEKFHYIRSCF